MGKKRLLIIIVAVFIAGVIAAPFISDIYKGIQTKQMIEELFAKQEFSMDVHAEGKLSGQQINLNVQLEKGLVGEQEISSVSYEGMEFFVTDNVIFFENGKGYRISDEIYSYMDLFKAAMGGAEVSQEMVDDNNVIVISLKDEENGEFDMNIRLTVKDESISMNVPAAVTEAIEAGNFGDLTELTENLFRLASAWSSMESSEGISAVLNVSGQCGIISIDQDFNIYSKKVSGKNIVAFEKNGFSAYFVEGVMYDGNGNAILGKGSDGSTSADVSGGIDAAQLIQAIYEICMEGDFACTEVGGKYVYSLTLDEAAIESIVYSLMPEAEDMDVFFSEGSAVITVADGEIESVKVNCSGTLKILMIEEEATLGAEITVTGDAAEFQMPEF